MKRAAKETRVRAGDPGGGSSGSGGGGGGGGGGGWWLPATRTGERNGESTGKRRLAAN